MLAQGRAAEDRYKRWSDKRLAHGPFVLIGCTGARRPRMCPRLVLHRSTARAKLHRTLQPRIGHCQPARLYLGFAALVGHSKAGRVRRILTVSRRVSTMLAVLLTAYEVKIRNHQVASRTDGYLATVCAINSRVNGMLTTDSK